jgi:2-polyprenyl-3-methyl-5-hydroxy-6-metoxy-1,4-benzoquinol methylase
MKNQICRFCNEQLNQIFIDLGESPLANSFLKYDMIIKREKFYPLCTFVCSKCFLVQLGEFESPDKIFRDYAYFSSFSETWLEHAKKYVDMMIMKYNLGEKSNIIEIASNDGYLLKNFKARKTSVLGIEPAINIAKVAEENGIPTIMEFFGTELAKKLVNEKNQADLLIGNNVLAHVPDLNDFVKGMKIILKPDGIATLEFPHLLQLIKYNQFDTIYHEHFSYFSFLTAVKIFTYHGLIIFDVEELPTHGGSLRIYVKHEENKSIPINNNVKYLIEKEEEFGLSKIFTYSQFQTKIEKLKENICSFFINAKKQNKKIVCYGAPAKGNTLLNYCKIGTDFIMYTVDRSIHKQGLYLPGTHILIKEPENILETKPDYIVILPWNLKEEITSQISYIRKWGGRIVTLIPEVNIH